MKNKLFISIIIFFLSLIIFSLFGFWVDKINVFLLSLILSLIIFLFSFYLFSSKKEQGLPPSKGKVALRYTMLCHRCNWEWMSNTADKKPAKCPNCGEHAKLELVGWRKVNVLPRKSNKNLMSYLKR